mmetsp:Transcript_21873/g.46978  ORF Transcript_21873/g.46978 Transcript_21873/m.46978 type:complete len:220 (+) Transcript_21873:2179-2838(+)
MLDVHIAVHLRGASVRTLLEGAHKHGLLSNLHSIHTLNSLLGCVISLIVYEPVPLGFSAVVGGNLARQDVPEQGKRVIQSLVVDGAIQVLHKHVARATLAKTRVTVRPHDTALTALDGGIIQGVQGLLRVSDIVKVHVSVPQGRARPRIPAHADRGHAPNCVENLIQYRLSHISLQISDIQRSELIVGVGVAGSCHAWNSRVRTAEDRYPVESARLRSS